MEASNWNINTEVQSSIPGRSVCEKGNSNFNLRTFWMRLEKAVECCRKGVEMLLLLSTLLVAGTGHKNNIGVVFPKERETHTCIWQDLVNIQLYMTSVGIHVWILPLGMAQELQCCGIKKDDIQVLSRYSRQNSSFNLSYFRKKNPCQFCQGFVPSSRFTMFGCFLLVENSLVSVVITGCQRTQGAVIFGILLGVSCSSSVYCPVFLSVSQHVAM